MIEGRRVMDDMIESDSVVVVVVVGSRVACYRRISPS